MYTVMGATALILCCTPEHRPLVTDASSYPYETISLEYNFLSLKTLRINEDYPSVLRDSALTYEKFMYFSCVHVYIPYNSRQLPCRDH